MKLIGAYLMMASFTVGNPAAGAEASGQFSVKLTALPAAPGGVAQHRLEKHFSGDLAGTSTGVIMSAGDPANGIAGYVAMEMVEGTLAGRNGGGSPSGVPSASAA